MTPSRPPARRAILVAALASVVVAYPGAAQDGETVTSSSSPSPAPSCRPAPAEPLDVGSLVWDASLPFLGGFIEGQERMAACLGLDLDLQDGEGNLDTQIGLIGRFIDEGKDLIIVTTTETEGIVLAIREANAAGVPVIAALTRVGEGAELVTFVGYDERAIGRKQGEMLLAAVGEEARIGLILGGPWDASVEEGLIEYLGDHPGIEIVEGRWGDGSEGEVGAVTQEWLSAYPAGELAAILGQGPELLAAAQRAADLGREDVRFFVGYYSERVDAAITEGLVAGTVITDPSALGRASVLDAWDWLSGRQEEVERPDHLLEPAIVTASNADEFPTWTVEPTPAPTPIPTPEPTPSGAPMDRAAFERKARRMCLQARPAGVYRVRGRPAEARAARGMDTAHLVLVEYRDLGGTRRREPRLVQDDVYDLEGTAPFSWESAGDVDILACLALRATRREVWRATGIGTLYTIDAADAIIWMVDAGDGDRVGRPWLRRPPKAGSGRNRILFGEGGPGIRPPPAADIVADVERFLGR